MTDRQQDHPKRPGWVLHLLAIYLLLGASNRISENVDNDRPWWAIAFAVLAGVVLALWVPRIVEAIKARRENGQ